jgi:hypothetical protein
MASTTQSNGGTATLAPPKPAANPTPGSSAPDTLVSGLHGAIGCDFIPASNRLAFVEYAAGNVSVLNLIRSASIVAQATTTLKGTFILDLDTGVQSGQTAPGDIWWDQQTAVSRQMAPVGGATIVNLGAVDYGSLTAAGLQTLTYGNTPIPGNDDTSNQLTNGDVFAVLTNKGNYAKVQVLSYGYDIEIQWVTYALAPAYQVLGSGYANPECIAVKSDGVHAFVSERSGDIVAVSLQSAARSAATVLTSGLNAPQQIVLNAAESVLYVVEFAAPGRLLAIDVTSNVVSTITSGLDQAVGVALSADETSAYVSEQSSAGGRVREVDLQTGAITNVATGFTAPFMLAFLDAADEHLAVVERDPANRIAVIDLSAGNTVTRPTVSLAFRPSALAPLAGGDVLVTCDAEIDEIALGLSAVTGPLLKGIGFVPFDRISTTTGLATTSVDPTYFYQVTNAPFGGTLPIMLDHAQAWADGAQYYSVLVDGAARSDSWTDYLWDTTTSAYVLQTITATTVAGHIVYPVRNPAVLELWYNPDLGSQVDTTSYPDKTHTLQIQFYSGTGSLVASSTLLTLLFENSPCSASVALPNINGVFAGAQCGVLDYTANSNLVTLAFTASQPSKYATFSFDFERGVNPLTPPSLSGPVTNATVSLSPTVAELIGPCTIAGFAEYLYVAASAINGEGRQSQYDASASLAFVLSGP